MHGQEVLIMFRFVNKLFFIVLAIASFWVYANEDDGRTIVNPIKSIEEQLVLNVSDDEKFNELFEKYKTYYLDLDSVYSSYIFLQKLYEDSPFEWVKGAEIYTSTRGVNKKLNNPVDGYDKSENKELNEISDLRLSQPNSVTLKNIESNLNKVRVTFSARACTRCHGPGGGGGGSITTVPRGHQSGGGVNVGNYIPPPNKIGGISGLNPAKRKTPLQGGGGLRKRWKDRKGNIYEWDSQHGALEKYNKQGKHLGEFNPETGTQTKAASKTRRVEP